MKTAEEPACKNSERGGGVRVGAWAPLQSRTNHILPFDAEIWLEFLSQQISSYEF